MDCLNLSYQEIITIVGVITGFLGVSLTFYSKYRDSNIKSRELQIKEKQYDDNKKYQELVSKKIEMLENISSILVEHNKCKPKLNIPDCDIGIDGKMEDLTLKEEKLMLDTFIKIDNVLEKNQLLITNEIQEIYQEIKDDLLNQDAKYYDFRINISTDNEEISDAYKDKVIEFYNKNKEKLDALLELLNNEIQNVRKKLQI